MSHNLSEGNTIVPQAKQQLNTFAVWRPEAT